MKYMYKLTVSIREKKRLVLFFSFFLRILLRQFSFTRIYGDEENSL